MDFGLVAQLIVIAFLWGGTNPLIKNGSKGVESVGYCDSSFVNRFYKELSFLLSNWNYLVPFGLNQLGSILFFFMLQSYDLNIIVPVTNSLSYSFTYLVGYLMGESKPNKGSFFGMLLIIMGTCLIFSKANCRNSDCQNCD